MSRFQQINSVFERKGRGSSGRRRCYWKRSMNSMWRWVVKLGHFRSFSFFCELVKHKRVRWWGENWGISAELRWGTGSISWQEDAVIARGALMSPAGLKHSSSSKSQPGGLLSLIGKGLAPMWHQTQPLTPATTVCV